MHIERHLTLPETPPSEAIALAARRLTRIGYAPSSQSELVYQRGSRIGSMTSANPQNLGANVTLQTQPHGRGTLMTLTWDVDLTGQVLTTPEMHYWRSEVDGVCDEVRAGVASPVNPEPLRRVLASGRRIVFTTWLYSVIMTLILGLLSPSILLVLLMIPIIMVAAQSIAVLRERRDLPSIASLSADTTPHAQTQDHEPRFTRPQAAHRDLSSRPQGALTQSDAPSQTNTEEKDFAWAELDDFERRLQEAIADDEAHAPATAKAHSSRGNN